MYDNYLTSWKCPVSVVFSLYGQKLEDLTWGDVLLFNSYDVAAAVSLPPGDDTVCCMVWTIPRQYSTSAQPSASTNVSRHPVLNLVNTLVAFSADRQVPNIFFSTLIFQFLNQCKRRFKSKCVTTKGQYAEKKTCIFCSQYFTKNALNYHTSLSASIIVKNMYAW